MIKDFLVDSNGHVLVEHLVLFVVGCVLVDGFFTGLSIEMCRKVWNWDDGLEVLVSLIAWPLILPMILGMIFVKWISKPRVKKTIPRAVVIPKGD